MEAVQGEGGTRNARLVDKWSLGHVAMAVVLTMLVGPWWALLLLTLWEPLEIFVVSRLAARFGIEFGQEALVNSLSDLAFNGIGAAAAWYLVLPFWDPLGVA